MITLTLSARGTLTLPKNIRKRFALKENDLLIAEATEAGILLRPATVYPVEMYSEKRLAEFDRHNNAALKKIFSQTPSKKPSRKKKRRS